MLHPIGTLVQRSDRWLQQHGDRQEDQLGIVVGEGSSWGEEWPLIHWEGRPKAELVYPDHITPVDRTGLRISYTDG